MVRVLFAIYGLAARYHTSVCEQCMFVLRFRSEPSAKCEQLVISVWSRAKQCLVLGDRFGGAACHRVVVPVVLHEPWPRIQQQKLLSTPLSWRPASLASCVSSSPEECLFTEARIMAVDAAFDAVSLIRLAL